LHQRYPLATTAPPVGHRAPPVGHPLRTRPVRSGASLTTSAATRWPPTAPPAPPPSGPPGALLFRHLRRDFGRGFHLLRGSLQCAVLPGLDDGMQRRAVGLCGNSGDVGCPHRTPERV